MYNVYVKRKIFIITEIVHMNAGVISEKEKVKESQSTKLTPSLNTHFGCRVWGVIVNPHFTAISGPMHITIQFIS